MYYERSSDCERKQLELREKLRQIEKIKRKKYEEEIKIKKQEIKKELEEKKKKEREEQLKLKKQTEKKLYQTPGVLTLDDNEEEKNLNDLIRSVSGIEKKIFNVET
jgi:peroxiredoxin family protein